MNDEFDAHRTRSIDGYAAVQSASISPGASSPSQSATPCRAIDWGAQSLGGPIDALPIRARQLPKPSPA